MWIFFNKSCSGSQKRLHCVCVVAWQPLQLIVAWSLQYFIKQSGYKTNLSVAVAAKEKKLLWIFEIWIQKEFDEWWLIFFVCGLNALCINTDFAFLVPPNYNLIINLSRINIFLLSIFFINKMNMFQVHKLPSDFVLKGKSLQCQRSL